jgi:hypothetical protein
MGQSLRISLNIGLITVIYGDMMSQSRHFVHKFTMNLTKIFAKNVYFGPSYLQLNFNQSSRAVNLNKVILIYNPLNISPVQYFRVLTHPARVATTLAMPLKINKCSWIENKR